MSEISFLRVAPKAQHATWQMSTTNKEQVSSDSTTFALIDLLIIDCVGCLSSVFLSSLAGAAKATHASKGRPKRETRCFTQLSEAASSSGGTQTNRFFQQWSGSQCEQRELRKQLANQKASER